MRWVLVALLALVGCKKAPETSPSADPAFWIWVAANVEGLKGVKTGREPVTEQLTAELRKVDPGLVFELGVGRDPFELTISADGKKELFPVVKRLVASAPVIPGTKVIAFRPRKDVEAFSMQIRGGKLSGKDLWFTAHADAERKGLMAVELFVPDLNDLNEEALDKAAFFLLEAAVGEFDVETKIGGIDIKRAPDEPAPPLRPLKELPATLDAWK
jgi:hypothetical protein